MPYRSLIGLGLFLVLPGTAIADADLILHNGKIVTVDKKFTVAQAIAIEGELSSNM